MHVSRLKCNGMQRKSRCIIVVDLKGLEISSSNDMYLYWYVCYSRKLSHSLPFRKILDLQLVKTKYWSKWIESGHRCVLILMLGAIQQDQICFGFHLYFPCLTNISFIMAHNLIITTINSYSKKNTLTTIMYWWK